MTMMITKFHKLIQSKILWGIFAVVISISFVGLFTEMPKQQKLRMSKVSPGKLDGKYVHPDEFRSAERHTRLAYALNFGRWPSLPPEMEPMIREEAWRRLVSLRTAEKMGLSASDAEVVAAIQREPSFRSQDGAFNPNAYRAFVQNMLYRGLGVTEQEFEQHLKQELTLGHLRELTGRGLLVTPEEILRTYHTVTDVFNLDYTLIEAASVTNEVEVSDAFARSYFEENSKDFTTEPMVKVKYVTFPIQEFADKVEISEEDAKAYYEDNIDRYTTIEEAETAEGEATDEAKEEAGELADTPPPVPVVQPFEEVRDDIVRKLQYKEAEVQAGRRATEFVVAVQRNAESGQPDFDRLAADIKRPVVLTEAFSATDTLEEVDAGADFVKAAFERDLSPEDYFSDPIVGDSALYVLALVEEIEPRIPAFEEVKEEVVAAARIQAIKETLKEKATDLETALSDGLAEGKAFAEIVSARGYKAEQVDNATAMAGLSSVPHGEILMQAVLSRNEGELTDPLPVPNGIMIARVNERRSSATMPLLDVQQQIVQSLLRERSPRLFAAFQKHLLEAASLEDLQPVSTPEEDEETTSTEDDPAPA